MGSSWRMDIPDGGIPEDHRSRLLHRTGPADDPEGPRLSPPGPATTRGPSARDRGLRRLGLVPVPKWGGKAQLPGSDPTVPTYLWDWARNPDRRDLHRPGGRHPRRSTSTIRSVPDVGGQGEQPALGRSLGRSSRAAWSRCTARRPPTRSGPAGAGESDLPVPGRRGPSARPDRRSADGRSLAGSRSSTARGCPASSASIPTASATGSKGPSATPPTG